MSSRRAARLRARPLAAASDAARRRREPGVRRPRKERAARVNPVDPPDYPLWPTMRRLLRLWRAEWRLVAVGLSCALAFTAISLAIPKLYQLVVDEAVVPRDRSKLWPLLGAVLGLAALRFCINFTRRYATARVGIRIEARM